MSVSDVPYVTLVRSPGAYSWSEVWCYFPVSAMGALASLSEESHITIVGDVYNYMLSTVWMENCRLQ